MKRIILKGISKRFRIGYRKRLGTLARILSVVSGKEPRKSFWALRDISATVSSGEIVGIVGANGSGKSTLLRIIAGIYRPDSGSVTTKGKIISLINLRIGLQPRLSMRDNIYLCCALFGSKPRLDSIVRFSELHDFVDTKVYQFSDGMMEKLAFAIAVHCGPEILLLDEVFAVGDKRFRKKSVRKIKDMVKAGASVVFVSHELEIVKAYCNKAIWLEKGNMRKIGNTKEILREYVS